MVYGLWFMVHGSWFMVAGYGLRVTSSLRSPLFALRSLLFAPINQPSVLCELAEGNQSSFQFFFLRVAQHGSCFNGWGYRAPKKWLWP
jgi:hypothetical protein